VAARSTDGRSDRADLPLGVFRLPDSAGAIYGTIATMAVIAGAARGSSHGRVLALAVGSVAVFWLVHVYAYALAHHLRGQAAGLAGDHRRDGRGADDAAGPSPALPAAALGGIHLLDTQLAVRLALWVGVAQLVAWGVADAQRQRWGWPTSLTAGVVNGAFGLVIVALEVLIY
jgi:hypothetical protein